MPIEVWDWHGRGNELRRRYRITRSGGTEPIIFEIHCTLSKGPFSIDMFVNFFLEPGLIQEECSLRASLAAENDAPEFFSVMAAPAADGSTLINVFGRQDVDKCFKLFSSGKNMTFQLLSESKQIIARLSLPNDDGFRKAYFICRSNAEGGPRHRTLVGDAMEEAFRRQPDDGDESAEDRKIEPGPAVSYPKSKVSESPSADGATHESKFIIKRISQNVFGSPMLEIEPPPLNRDGVPDFSEALEQVIAPHLKGRDNISLRFIDQGLPTTVTAVSSLLDVEYEGVLVTYSIRLITFKTRDGKTACNIHIRPESRCVMKNDAPIKRDSIYRRQTYDFCEVYEDMEKSRDDLQRLLKIADRHFRDNY